MQEQIDVKETLLSTDKKYLNALNVVIFGSSAKEGSVFTMQFFNITFGQSINANISISECSFVKDEILHYGISGYKIYKDNLTGCEIKIHIYTLPIIVHGDGDLLNTYTYEKNFTNKDRIVLSIDAVQNGVDLTGRRILFTNDIDVADTKMVSYITTYNNITQSYSTKMFRTFDSYIPSQVSSNAYYKIVVHVTSKNPTAYAGLSRGSFDGLTAVSVSNQDTTSTYNVTERVDFIDDNYNIISCDINMNNCYKDTQVYVYRNTTFPAWCTPSNLFIAREYPKERREYNAWYGREVQVGWESDRMSLNDNYELTYTMTFLSSINKSCIKDFSVILGPVNDGSLFNAYESRAVFELYDAFSDVLLYKNAVNSDNSTAIKPFENYD